MSLLFIFCSTILSISSLKVEARMRRSTLECNSCVANCVRTSCYPPSPCGFVYPLSAESRRIVARLPSSFASTGPFSLTVFGQAKDTNVSNGLNFYPSLSVLEYGDAAIRDNPTYLDTELLYSAPIGPPRVLTDWLYYVRPWDGCYGADGPSFAAWGGDEGAWPGLCQNGSSQSPIDIDTSSLTDITFIAPELFILDSFSLEQLFDYSIENDGVDIRFMLYKWSDISKAWIWAQGGGYLFSVGFTAPSQHRVDGQRYPLEMQLNVLQFDKGEPRPISVMFVIGNHNPHLQQFIDAFSFLEEPRGRLTNFEPKRNISFKELLTEFKDQPFATYEGSTHRPPCKEGFLRVVKLEPLQMSQQQMEAFLRIRRCSPLIGHHFLLHNYLWGNARGLVNDEDRIGFIWPKA